MNANEIQKIIMMKKNKNTTATVAPQNALSHNEGKYISKFEYFCVLLSRAGGMFGTTLTGSLAAAFLHELYYGPVSVDAEGIANILAVQTTITTICSILIGVLICLSLNRQTTVPSTKNPARDI